MKKIYNITIKSFFIATIIMGCSPIAASPEDNGLPSKPQNYRVEIIDLSEPVYETIRTENIEQPNCNGTGDVDNVVERTMGINHSIEVGLGLTVDIDGKLELFGTGVDLGAAISNELGYQYGVIESISRSITVRAAPKTHVIHTVKLSEVWESGTARVSSNGESIDIPFRFRANFSIDLLDSTPVSCETGLALVTQTVVQPITQPTSTTSSSIPQLIGTITVPAYSASGINYKAPESGMYSFKYTDSAFTAYNGCWSTQIVSYLGPVPQWKDSENLDFDNALFAIGTAVCSSTKEIAINRVQGQLATAKLNKDDVITVVTGDSYHSDNIGSIVLEIYFLPK